jgi:hypothetical protein
VGRLAERHGIDVRVTASPYGGARATVVIPLDFIAGDDGSDYDQTWSDEPSVGSGWRPGSEPEDAPGPRISGPVRALGVGGDRTDPGAPELPRRVRQANLAPQLRDATPAPGPASTDSPATSPPATSSPTTGSPTTSPPTTRPPEETRSLMTSLQEGWKRGREEEEPDE